MKTEIIYECTFSDDFKNTIQVSYNSRYSYLTTNFSGEVDVDFFIDSRKFLHFSDFQNVFSRGKQNSLERKQVKFISCLSQESGECYENK